MQTMKNYILLFALVMISKHPLLAQISSDSISIILNLPIHDTVKLNKLDQFSKTANKQEWHDLEALKAYKAIAQKNKLFSKICYANNEIGYKYQMKGFTDSAFKCYNENVEIALSIKDSLLWIRGIYKIGFLLNSIKQFAKAAPYFELLEKHVKKPSGKATIQLALGGNYMDMGQEKLAIDYLNKALVYYESLNKTSEYLEHIYPTLVPFTYAKITWSYQRNTTSKVKK